LKEGSLIRCSSFLSYYFPGRLVGVFRQISLLLRFVRPRIISAKRKYFISFWIDDAAAAKMNSSSRNRCCVSCFSFTTGLGDRGPKIRVRFY